MYFQKIKLHKMAAEGQNYVATVVRDDFFNDPFFKVNINFKRLYISFYVTLHCYRVVGIIHNITL